MHFYLYAIISLIPIALGFLLRPRVGNGVAGWLVATGAAFALGFLLLPNTSTAVLAMSGAACLTLGAILLVFGFLEFAILRTIGLFRLGALTRVTYYEGLLQPFTLILLVVGALAILMLAFMPFFTISEDNKMYRDVAVSLVFLFSLPVMIFASTKVIDEEIENRTMLTLMSKPIARWQVVVGKYLGVMLLCFAMVAALGLVTGACAYIRYFDDMLIDYRVATPAQVAALDLGNLKANLALAPALLLQFLQIATLAAVSVAISTRYGLVINITVIILLYIAANLARYVGHYNLPAPLDTLANLLAHLLPGLGLLDLNQRLLFGQYNLGNRDTTEGLPSYAQIWQYTSLATLYALLYISAVISFGIAAFRNRELT
jgi:ABC-type transport system involved in multi-copper enzyme maturation permease subunit